MKAEYRVNEVDYIVIKDSNDESKFRANVEEFLNDINKSFDEVFMFDSWTNFEDEEEKYVSYQRQYKSWMDIDEGDYLVYDKNSKYPLMSYTGREFTTLYNVI